MPTEDELTGSPQRRPKQSPTSIGNHKLKPSTLMMGYGFDPALERRLAEAADLPDLDLRVSRRRRTASASSRASPASVPVAATEGLVYSRFNGPEPGNPRGPARALGRRRGAPDLLQRHDRHRHPAPDLRPARRRGRPLRPALCGDRDDHRQDPRASSASSMSTFPPARRAKNSTTVHGSGQGEGPRVADLSRKPGQPDQRTGRRRGGPRRARRRVRRRSELPPIAIDNTFLGPLWASRSSRARTSGLQPDQICRRAQRPRRGRRSPASKALLDQVRMMRNTMGGICDPQHRVDADAQPRNAGAAHGRAQARMPPRSAPSSAIIPRSKAVGYLGFLEEGSRQADIYSATAPARARPSRST